MSCLLGRIFEDVVAEPWAALLLWGVPVALAATHLAFSREGKGHLRNRALCATCGYDLRATPDRCPECGTIPKPDIY
jgi:hypothetical protein